MNHILVKKNVLIFGFSTQNLIKMKTREDIKEMEKLKKNKGTEGITLIALVVTAIV